MKKTALIILAIVLFSAVVALASLGPYTGMNMRMGMGPSDAGPLGGTGDAVLWDATGDAVLWDATGDKILWD